MNLFARARLHSNRLLSKDVRSRVRSQPDSKQPNGTYHLSRYVYRSCLTLIGPWLVFGLYAYISFAFLNRAPVNDILATVELKGTRWLYYIWFVVAVFTLDWSRTALTNVEAAALMHMRLAPLTGVGLMWHTDSKWANPLWWLRALWTTVSVMFPRRTVSPSDVHSGPTRLWTFLGLTTSLIYVALPLSGLTMEVSNISVHGRDQAQIYGPSATTFNLQSRVVTIEHIQNKWPLGQATTPPQGSLLYAPNCTPNVSLTYFDDRASNHSANIEFFAGPTVHEPVAGRAWGMYANISCKPIASSRLQMLRVSEAGYSVRTCSLNGTNITCDPSSYIDGVWLESDFPKLPVFSIPVRLMDTAKVGNNMSFAYVAVADGFVYNGNSQDARNSPYVRDGSHDDLTFDAVEGRRPEADTTNAMFEMYLIESSTGQDEILTRLVEGEHSGLVDIWNKTESRRGSEPVHTTYAGIALHCDITTAVGLAELDPSHRTFSSFQHSRSYPDPDPNSASVSTRPYQQMPPQVLAVMALGTGINVESGIPDAFVLREGMSPVWNDLHTSVGLPQLFGNAEPGYDGRTLPYHALKPSDLQRAIYKLLGESVIAAMDEGGVAPWKGELYQLESVSYLVPGILSWKYVLILLGLWALILSGGALWTIFFAGPRWAASLDGFEMFKFGAQYSDMVDRFDTVEFRGCNSALRQIPGMVGMLPGRASAIDPHTKLGFIGLSENVASRDVTYTLDRGQAATRRPI